MKTLLTFLVLAFVAFGQQPPLRPVKVTLTSSATDTYAGTASPTLSAYVSGQVFMFTANTANTGAASINVDGVGALTIVKLGGAINTTLADNDIRNGQQVMCQYDGTNCQMLSQLGNAASGGGGGMTFVGGYYIATQAQGVTRYWYPGITSASATATTINLPKAATSQTIYFNTSAPSSGQTITATLQKNGADTACVLVNTGPATTSNTTCAISYAANETFGMKIVTSASSGSVWWSVSMVME